LLHPFIYLFSPHPFIPASLYRHWLAPSAGFPVRITLKAYFHPFPFPLSHHISLFQSSIFRLSKVVIFSFASDLIFSFSPKKIESIKDNKDGNECSGETASRDVKPAFQTGLFNR